MKNFKQISFFFLSIFIINVAYSQDSNSVLDTFPRMAITDPSIPMPSTDITKKYTWSYGGYTFTTDIKLKRADFDYYKSLSKNLAYQKYAEDDASHPYFIDLCKQLDEDAKVLNYTGLDLVNYLTAFVQQAIPYKSEIGEYKRYPIETLIENGDCEDKSALLASLLNTFGFDAKMVLLPGHMAVAIATTNMGGYYLHNGVKYSFIESTYGGWRVGDVPSSSQTVGATILDVKHTAYYKRTENEPSNYSNVDTMSSGDNTPYDPSANTISKSSRLMQGVFGSSSSSTTVPSTRVVYVPQQTKIIYVPAPSSQVIYTSPPQTNVYYNGSGYVAPQSMYYNAYMPNYINTHNPPIKVYNNNCTGAGSIQVFGNTVVRW